MKISFEEKVKNHGLRDHNIKSSIFSKIHLISKKALVETDDEIILVEKIQDIYYNHIPKEKVEGLDKKTTFIPGLIRIALRYRDGDGIKRRSDYMFVRKNKKFLDRLDDYDEKHETKEEEYRDALGDYLEKDHNVNYVLETQSPFFRLFKKMFKVSLITLGIIIIVSIFEAPYNLIFAIPSMIFSLSTYLYVLPMRQRVLVISTDSVFLIQNDDGDYSIRTEMDIDSIKNIDIENMWYPFHSWISIGTGSDRIEKLATKEPGDIENRITASKI